VAKPESKGFLKKFVRCLHLQDDSPLEAEMGEVNCPPEWGGDLGFGIYWSSANGRKKAEKEISTKSIDVEGRGGGSASF